MAVFQNITSRLSRHHPDSRDPSMMPFAQNDIKFTLRSNQCDS